MVAALRMAPWRRLADSEQLHVFLGGCVALILLWHVRAQVDPAWSFHLLGVTVFTLMFGWSFALIGSSIALAAVTFNLGHGWNGFVVNAITLGLLPITLTQVILVLVRSLLPKNFFIYVLVNGFLTAGFVALVSGYLATGLLVMSGAFSMLELEETFIPFFPLMFLPEAILNGWIATILVLYRPHWVGSFSDRLYLHGK
ncbi:MAG TPA: molecular chaperone DnaJ [Sedimenticola thiotaurini]|uniref:Molecular chaperone DnaJ n=1 Tax=Sedimenticola thiotaurini TaxID=1543721 RepID=A0A831RN96_9GAMM|nr:molecular chaperone DnaJ [Sedimenticola thiotaurini]